MTDRQVDRKKKKKKTHKKNKKKIISLRVHRPRLHPQTCSDPSSAATTQPAVAPHLSTLRRRRRGESRTLREKLPTRDRRRRRRREDEQPAD